MLIFSKILKIEPKLNMIVEIVIETSFEIRKFDVPNLNFNARS